MNVIATLQETWLDHLLYSVVTVCEDGNECRRCCAGNAAQILGIVCIFFAVDLEKAQLPRPETDWLLIGFVAFHFLTHLLLSLINCVAEYKHAKT